MELVIRGGRVIDPESGLDKEVNIGIENGKIAKICESDIEGKETINADNMIVSPGFIDIHMHEDPVAKLKEEAENSSAIFESLVRMGVTSAFGGNCGYSRFPLKPFFQDLESKGIPLHYGSFSGYNTLREFVGVVDPYASIDEEQKISLHDNIRQELETGAVGLSIGFEYSPGISTREAIEAVKVAAEYKGKLISIHFRADGHQAEESIEEMVEISRETGAAVQVSHIGSCAGFPGVMDKALQIIDEARAEDIDIMGDCYPYHSFCTAIGTAVFDGGCFQRWGINYSSIYIAEGEYRGEYCTKELFEKLREESPETMVIGFSMDEEEIQKAIKHPLIMISSDGSFSLDQGHPRGAGAFPRVLGRFVREERKISLMEALAKMTIVPARRLGLKNKGRISKGKDADLVLFDLETIIDGADFNTPTRKPEGIKTVILKGVPAVRNENIVNYKAGRVIRLKDR